MAKLSVLGISTPVATELGGLNRPHATEGVGERHRHLRTRPAMLVFVMLVTAATSVVAIRRETPAAVVVRVNGQPLVMRGAVST
ncbi:MAG: hypothetical protein DLM54_12185, partial [Acidimicrobiales bacterium]